MHKYFLIALLTAAPAFATPTSLTCTWDDPAAGVKTWYMDFTPFPVTPPAVSRIEAKEEIVGTVPEKRLSVRYATLNVDATTSSFPKGVYQASDPRDVFGQGFTAAERIELRIDKVSFTTDTAEYIGSFAKGTIARTVGGATKSYSVNCLGYLYKKP